MSPTKFYEYIIERFYLGAPEDSIARYLILNIIEYVGEQCFDLEDAHAHLYSLLSGAIGIEKREVELYNSYESE